MGRFALVVMVVAACGHDDDPDGDATRRCAQVREHVIDLRLADASNIDVAAHRVAMRNALGDGFVASCKATMTTAQASCVLSAVDAASANACH